MWARWFWLALPVLGASIPVFSAGSAISSAKNIVGALRINMNLFQTWGTIPVPFAAGTINDRTESYMLVFSGITVLLIISAVLTGLLFKP